MSAASDRTLVRRVLAGLRKAYGRHKVAGGRSALEELLLGILASGLSEQRAKAALADLESTFVDWNEVRVSSVYEVAEAMPAIPNAVEKAEIIGAALRKVFDRANEMSLDFLAQKSPHTAARLIAGIPNFPEPALARATIQALGHEVFPPTPKVVAVCQRLGLLNHNNRDFKVMFRRLQKAIPGPSMMEFHWLVARHATNVCLSDEPSCMKCRLRKHCRTGRAVTRKSKRTGKSARVRKTGKVQRKQLQT